MNRKRPKRPNKAQAQKEEAIGQQAERTLFDFMRFWKVCSDKRCRRAHACKGELHFCRERHWYQVPQDVKSWIYAGIKARHEGHSVEESAKIADAARARFASNPPAGA